MANHKWKQIQHRDEFERYCFKSVFIFVVFLNCFYGQVKCPTFLFFVMAIVSFVMVGLVAFMIVFLAELFFSCKQLIRLFDGEGHCLETIFWISLVISIINEINTISVFMTTSFDDGMKFTITSLNYFFYVIVLQSYLNF